MSEHRYTSDHSLLRLFVDHEDDTAFSALVERHGPLVMGLCRRILQHQQDTEDAFQATFLVLARKASSIKKGASLSSWLYKVAFRIAIRAKHKRAQWQSRQSFDYPEMESFSDRDRGGDPESASVVDEEIRKLPEKYRVPVLLCYLQGYTNEEAARRLKCPTGTVKIRLLRAREILRKRLVRQGVGWSMLTWLFAHTGEAQASVPDSLLNHTVDLATQIQLGSELANLATTPQVLQMARSWFKKAALTKMKVACAVLMTVLLVVFADQMSPKAKGATVEQPRHMLPSNPTQPDIELTPTPYPNAPKNEQFVLRAHEAPSQLH